MNENRNITHEELSELLSERSKNPARQIAILEAGLANANAEVARLTGLLHAENVRKDALEGRVAGLEAEKDGAYSERDKLVSVLSKVYPASLERHQPENDNWENDWRWVVFVDTPTGQVSWHIHDSELPMFSHLRRNAGRVWDGHTTDEKYSRLARITPLEDALTAEVTALRARVAELEDLNSDPVCEWKRESDWNSDTWEAGCGMSWVFEDGDPSENEMNYCPSCGRRLVIIIAPPEAE